MQVSRGIAAASPSPPCVLTIGNFDGIHKGHQAIIEHLRSEARALGVISALLTFEPHPREFFAPQAAPARLTTLREKLELLADFSLDRVHVCRFSDAFSRMSAEDFITRIIHKNLNARTILVGDDFRFGANRSGDLRLLKERGLQHDFKVLIHDDVTILNERVSSTRIRQALIEGDLSRAANLLGRAYSISGRVIHGNKLGRELGFPTANILMKHNKPPLAGIFAVELRGLNDRVLRGVASLGVRPTVYDHGKPVLEVFIFDFNQEIYRHQLQVTFLHKLRDEEKYPDLETLKKQIAMDIEQAHTYFKHHNDRL